MGRVAEEITAEVDQLSVSDKAPGLAALALSLAESVDAATAPAAKAQAAKELRGVLADLRKLAPVGQKGDAVDAVGRKREERRAKLRAAQEGS